MPVTNSTYVLDDHTQIDGRRYVTETHTVSSGNPVVIQYLASISADYGTILNARVASINEQLAEQEASQIIGTN